MKRERIFAFLYIAVNGNNFTINILSLKVSNLCCEMTKFILIFFNFTFKLFSAISILYNIPGRNGIRTHNHLVRKRTLNHLAKLVFVNFTFKHVNVYKVKSMLAIGHMILYLTD